MSDNVTGMSHQARQFIEMMENEVLQIPRANNIEQYRRNTFESFRPTVLRALDRYPVSVESISINQVLCQQVTAVDWSEENGICIQYGYGGGMVSGSPYEDLIITSALAHNLKARVIVPDYRLAPENPYPAAADDFFAVYPTLLESYGTERLVVSGESAGGNLAIGLLIQMRNQGLALPKCAALFSPWVDLANQGDSHQFNDQRDPTLSTEWVNSAAAMYAGEFPTDHPDISPIHADLSDLPPIIISSGTRELLLSQSLILASRIREAGGIVDLRIWEGLWHVFEFYDDIPEATLSIEQTADFIRQYI